MRFDPRRQRHEAFFERMGQKGEADLLEGALKGDEIALPRQVGEFATEQIVARHVKN